MQTPDASGIAKVTLVRLSVMTHTHNTNQRLMPLGFGQTAGG